MIPLSIGFLWGVHHFEKLEKKFETPLNAKELGESMMLSASS